jgi:hypothetical protein
MFSPRRSEKQNKAGKCGTKVGQITVVEVKICSSGWPLAQALLGHSGEFTLKVGLD